MASRPVSKPSVLLPVEEGDSSSSRAIRLVDRPELSSAPRGQKNEGACPSRRLGEESCFSEDSPPAPPSPTPLYAVLSATPAGEGETVTVVLSCSSEEGERRLRLPLLVEQYAELGIRVGEISPREGEALLEAGELCRVICRGVAMLACGDHSAARLIHKLMAKGVSKDTATRAVAYLRERGYLQESRAAVLRAQQGVSKGWGRQRICEDLMSRGFSREVVREAMASLSETDWVECCVAAIRKRHWQVPEDKGGRQRLIASVMRLGYDADTVRQALRLLSTE